MSTPQSEYSRLTAAVEKLIADPLYSVDPVTNAYMICRAALLFVLHRRNAKDAGEMAYRLADEISTHRTGPER